MNDLKNFEQILENQHINYFTRGTIEALKSEYEKALQQLREKEARIADLENSLQSLHRRLHERFEFVLGDIGSDLQAAYEQSVALLKKSPQQSLAAIQVDAVESMAHDWDVAPVPPMNSTDMRKYAQQLRDKAKA